MANTNNRNNRQNGNNQRNQSTSQQKTPPASTQTSAAENTPAEPVEPEAPNTTDGESGQIAETSSQDTPQGSEGTSAPEQASASENASNASDTPPSTPDAPSEDTVVFAAPPAPAPDTEESVVEEVVVETPEPTSLEKSDNDDELVTNLKEQFNAFVEANSALGTEPAHYQMSAKLAAQIVKYVVRFPKVDVLDAVVTFFKEHLDTTCSFTSFMKGSTTLPEVDQQLIGFFYNFFNELARGQIVRIDNGKVLSVLKKPEFVNYHQRKMAVLKQMAKQK